MNFQQMLLRILINIIPLICIVYIVVGINMIKNRHGEKGNYFSFLIIASAIYSLGYYLELNTYSFNVVLYVRCFEYFGVIFALTYGILFSYEIAKGKRPTKFFIGILHFVSLVLWIMFITDPLHHFVYKQIELKVINSYGIIITQKGTGFYLIVTYFIVFLLLSSLFLFNAYRKSNSKKKRNVYLSTFSAFQLFWINILIVALGLDKYIDFIPISILIVCAIFLYNEIKNDMFESEKNKWIRTYKNIEQPAFLIDSEKEIISYNQKTEDLSFDKNELNKIITNENKKEFVLIKKVNNQNKYFKIKNDIYDLKKDMLTIYLMDITEEKNKSYLVEAFFNSIDDFVFIFEQDGKILFKNDIVSTKLGYSDEEINKMKINDFHIKSFENDIKSIISDTINYKTNNCNLSIKTKNNQIIVVETRLWTDDFNGRNVIYSMSKDVSLLKETVGKFEQSFYKNPVMMSIIDINTKKLIEANNAFIEKIGYERNELIDNTINDLKLFDNNKQELQEKLFIKKESFDNLEENIITKNGKIINVLISGGIIQTKDSVQLLAVFLDVTKENLYKKRIEKEINERSVLLDNINTQIWYLSDKHTYGAINDAHAQFSGKKKEDIAYKDIFSIYPKKMADFCVKGNEEVFRTRNSISFEYWMENYKGENRLLNIRKIPKIKNDGSVEYVVCSAEDITEKWFSQQELQKSEEQFRLLITQMEQGLAVHEIVCNDEGKVIDYIFLRINKSFEKLTGLKSEDIIGKRATEVLPNLENYWLEVYGKVALTGVPYVYENYVKDLGKYYNVNVYSPKKNQFAIIFSDVTLRKILENKLAQEKKLLETTLISIGDGVISTDKEGKIVFLNRVAELLTGWQQKDAEGKNIEEVFYIINEYTRKRSDNIVEKVIKTRKILELANHTILISKDGIERPIEDSAAPIVQENGDIVGAVLVFRDFSYKKMKQEEIQYISYHDGLTNLYNRRYFEESLKKYDNKEFLPLSLIMADVNGLKLTNDAFGHRIGDQILKRVADILKNECRENDIVARVGGDEFMILLKNTGREDAEKLIKRISNKISNENVENIILSASLGFDTKYKQIEDINQVYKKAEDEMYRKKLSESFSMRNRTIKLIINTLYEKNEMEKLHSQRVSKLSEMLASEMNFSSEEISQIRIAGLMHDIGKIGIQDSILNMKKELSKDEWQEIKRHSEIGYRILSAVSEFNEIANIVLEHHERIDGKGYPKGLKDDEILVQAKIIAITDAYDAMTSDRSYRKATSEENAIKEIKKGAGSQFDEKIAKVFVEKVLKKSW